MTPHGKEFQKVITLTHTLISVSCTAGRIHFPPQSGIRDYGVNTPRNPSASFACWQRLCKMKLADDPVPFRKRREGPGCRVGQIQRQWGRVGEKLLI